MSLRTRALLFAAFAAVTAACGSSAVTTVTGPTATRCQASVTNSSPSFNAAGGTGEVKVTVARECAWSSSTTTAWIEIVSGKEGQGDGTIAYRVNANADPILRKGTISIGETQAEVAQEGAACRYTVSVPSEMFGPAGGRAGIDVRTHSACAWTATSDAGWVTLNPSSGRGEAVIEVEAQANGGAERAVTLTIGSDRVVLRQRSAAPPPPAPAPAPAPTPAPTPAPPPAPAPAPTPAPTPPAPAPTPPRTIELSGEVDDVRGICPAVTFELRDRKVRTTAQTVFARGSCKDLSDDDDVEIKLFGEIQADASIVATRIEFKK